MTVPARTGACNPAPGAAGDPEPSVPNSSPVYSGVPDSGAVESDAPMRAGWALGRESWSFHRQFFARVGRPTLPDEYGAMLRQIRRGGTAELLARIGRGAERCSADHSVIGCVARWTGDMSRLPRAGLVFGSISGICAARIDAKHPFSRKQNIT